MANINLSAVILGIFALLSVITISTTVHQPNVALGAVARGNDYQATSTNNITGSPAEAVLQNVPGTLGTVNITGSNSGVMNLFDATTSNVNLRTGQPASSTILLASFPTGAATGTYSFDRSFYNGLYLSVTSNAPTSTITFRQ